MSFLRRCVLVGGFLIPWLVAAHVHAGALDLAPTLEAGFGYDGNFFLDEDAAAQVKAFPLRGAGDLAVTWLPSLRGRLRAHAGYARERLYANPVLGTLGSFTGGVDGLLRPSFWSFVSLEAWGGDHRTTGSADIAFLSATLAGAQVQAGYRFAWATLGLWAGVEAATYPQQPVTAGVDRRDAFANTGLFGEWTAAGRWRADLAANQDRSNFHGAAYRGSDLRLSYAHDLWSGAEAGAEVGWRTKAYTESARADHRWRAAAGLEQRLGDALSVRAAAAQAWNRSNMTGNNYEWTTFECTFSVQPHWSYLY